MSSLSSLTSLYSSFVFSAFPLNPPLLYTLPYDPGPPSLRSRPSFPRTLRVQLSYHSFAMRHVAFFRENGRQTVTNDRHIDRIDFLAGKPSCFGAKVRSGVDVEEGAVERAKRVREKRRCDQWIRRGMTDRLRGRTHGKDGIEIRTKDEKYERTRERGGGGGQGEGQREEDRERRRE